MTNTKLRSATHADAQAIVDVIHRAFEEYRGKLQPPSGAHAERAETIRALFEGGERAFVAEESDSEKMVGCVFYRLQTNDADTCYLHRLAVVPEARSRGIASALVQEVENAALAEGLDYVSLGVRIVLTDNRSFYLKRGYYPVAYAAHSGYAAPTYTTMRKRIGPPIEREVRIEPWSPAWQEQYTRAAAEVRSILGAHLLEIHHMGSTAIPNMPAKPIIDLLGVASDLQQIDRCEPRLILHGWQPRGEYGIPGRRYFRKGSDAHHTHHLHIYHQGHAAIERQLRFVEYLTVHPDEARRYAKLKQQLSVEHQFAPITYTEAKGPLVEELLARALAERQ